MIRLAHLSDIHLTSAKLEWTWRDWFDKRFTSWLNYRVLGRRHRFRNADEILGVLMAELRERRPDHLIFSGDATALGFEAEFRHAAEALGVAKGEIQGLAVPGNHDYCTPAAARSMLFEKYFEPWQQGRRVDNERYPFAQRVGPLWLVAVNTSTGNFWPWDAGGSAGEAQRDRLARLLAELEPGPRILITHYPVCLSNKKVERKTHGLKDMPELVRVAAAGGVCLWLHGHRHGFYFHVETEHAPFPIVCVGSATQTGYGTYAEYSIEGSEFSAQMRVFDAASKAFRDGESFSLELRC